RFYPTETKSGVAPARADAGNILSQIKMAKRKSDLLVIYFHWGAEYQDYPLRYQRELAHKSIDAGADLVLGAHPHVIQGLEVYKKKLIAYSLGDFVFDHYSRKTGETFILRVNLSSKSGTMKAEIIPVYVTASGQPTLVYGKEAGSILTRLLKISEIFGTQLVIKGDRAKLTFDAEK
ncbi:MAG TPA: CapA family protein, partial [Candidatus Subteraquimicrobiales bacterium]